MMVHKKHPSPTPQITKVALHEIITRRLKLEPYDPRTDSVLVDRAKKGRFNQSNCAIALYSNAFAQKAMFPPTEAPFGYLYKKNDDLFSFGVYRRYDGKLFGGILPLSSSLDSMSDFSREALSALPISGVYVRFLRKAEYRTMTSNLFGFDPAKEEPWLTDAPEEDESLCHSRVEFSKIMDPAGDDFTYSKLRQSYKRGEHFLRRFGYAYGFTKLDCNTLPLATDIVTTHFGMIDAKGKLVGSTHHDYLGLLRPEIISLKSVVAYLGFLQDMPISVFICESNGPDGQIAGYAGITLRAGYSDSGISGPDIQNDNASQNEAESTGASALPTYAFGRLFKELAFLGYRSFYMGGSEHADMDNWKQRQMNAEMDPTYWAVLLK